MEGLHETLRTEWAQEEGKTNPPTVTAKNERTRKKKKRKIGIFAENPWKDMGIS